MNKETQGKKELLDMLDGDPTYNKDTHKVEVVFDPVNNKVYWQTRPFLRNGKIIVKRIAEEDVEVEKAYTVCTIYKTSRKYNTDLK